MKVRELIEELQKLNGDLEVYQSSDGEGNSYRPTDVVQAHHAHRFNWGIELDYVDEEEEEEEEEYPESYEGVEEIVIIWPSW